MSKEWISAEEITLEIRDDEWGKASKAIRWLRESHRDAGGTSKLRKNGTSVYFSFEGSVQSVLDLSDGMKELKKALDDYRVIKKQKMYDLVDRLESHERDRKAYLMELLVDELAKSKR